MVAVEDLLPADSSRQRRPRHGRCALTGDRVAGTIRVVSHPAPGRSVFVVHGRNEALRRAMFDFLRSIDLAPMEWGHAVELTGAASPYIGQVLDAAFEHAQAVVVLQTPDEIAYLQPRYGNGEHDPETQPAPQARPNVLFEAGMAMGRNADRTVLVEVGHVRQFSDVAGRHVVRLSNSLDSRQALAQRVTIQVAGAGGVQGCPVIAARRAVRTSAPCLRTVEM